MIKIPKVPKEKFSSLRVLILCLLPFVSLSIYGEESDKVILEYSGLSLNADGFDKDIIAVYPDHCFLYELSPTVNILYNQSIFLNSVFRDSLFVLDNGMTLDDVIASGEGLDYQDLGDLIFSACPGNTLAALKSIDPYMSNGINDREIINTVGFLYSVIGGDEPVDLEDFYDKLEDFGSHSTRREQIFFLHLLGSIGRDCFDDDSLSRGIQRFLPDPDQHVTYENLLDAYRRNLNGEKVDYGLCFDTELLLVDIAKRFDMDGGLVLSTNRSGTVHPSALFFDLSEKSRTTAYYLDWDNVAVFEFNTPEELADCLAETDGTHLLSKCLYDDEGKPLKMIHSRAEKMVLEKIGHKDLIDYTDLYYEYSVPEKSPGLRKQDYNLKFAINKINYGVNYYSTPFARDNILISAGTGKKMKRSPRITSTSCYAFEMQGPGTTVPFFDNHDNEHVKFLYHNEILFNSGKIPIKNLHPCWCGMFAGFETTLGLESPTNRNSSMKNFVAIPLLMPKAGIITGIGRKEVQGWELDFACMGSCYFLVPRQIKDSVTTLSTYLNTNLDEIILDSRVWLAAGPGMFFYTGYTVTFSKIDTVMNTKIGFINKDILSFSLYWEKGFPNPQFPVFYRQNEYKLGYQTDISISSDLPNAIVISVFGCMKVNIDNSKKSNMEMGATVKIRF